MKVMQYEAAYERDYSNRIGPGPAAYSKMDDKFKTDRFKKRAFTKSIRLLAGVKDGPGPAGYIADAKSSEHTSLRM